MNSKPLDKIFILIVSLLVIGGFFFFTSASLGLLAQSDGASFKRVFISQILIGLCLGLATMFTLSRVNYKSIRRYSFAIFLIGCILAALVFVPGIGFMHGGAKRWIDLRFMTFQPSEFLKLGFVLFFSSWLVSIKEEINTFRGGTIPLLVFLAIPAALLIAEPDTGTFGVIAIAGLGMFLVAGGRLWHIICIVVFSVIGLYALVQFVPHYHYLEHRITTLLNPDEDPTGTGYQINQSLLAVGSGEMFGRGFGQSIQKFNFLPESTNDSIFAVIAEEFGFLGSASLVLLFLFFCLRGFRIANHSPDQYGKLVAVGLVLLIVSQSYINISSMVGIFPLTGVPLIFISHGGTALLFALAEVGIILNISRWQKVEK